MEKRNGKERTIFFKRKRNRLVFFTDKKEVMERAEVRSNWGSTDNSSARDGVASPVGRSAPTSSIINAAKGTAHTVLSILVHFLSQPGGARTMADYPMKSTASSLHLPPVSWRPSRDDICWNRANSRYFRSLSKRAWDRTAPSAKAAFSLSRSSF